MRAQYVLRLTSNISTMLIPVNKLNTANKNNPKIGRGTSCAAHEMKIKENQEEEKD